MSTPTHAAPPAHGHGQGHGHGDHGHPDDGMVHAHVSPWQFMVAIFAALICLTVLTVAVSYFDFGAWNGVVAMLIATMKAALVATFFMHLKYDKPFHSIIFVMSFVFLGVFLLFTSDDIGTRGRVMADNGVMLLPSTGAAAPGGMPAVTPAETTGTAAGGHTGSTGAAPNAASAAPAGH